LRLRCSSLGHHKLWCSTPVVAYDVW
jgi:hypothetical protein